MSDFICILTTPNGLCCNCGFEGITPIRNAQNRTFCSDECVDEFNSRAMSGRAGTS